MPFRNIQVQVEKYVPKDSTTLFVCCVNFPESIYVDGPSCVCLISCGHGHVAVEAEHLPEVVATCAVVSVEM